jgi:L-rhamnose mutarotase
MLMNRVTLARLVPEGIAAASYGGCLRAWQRLHGMEGTTVKYVGLTLNLKDDPRLIAEYKDYHRHVWPEVEQSLRRAGIQRMKIFLLGCRLFMYMETADDYTPSQASAIYLQEPKVLEWENIMRKLQEPVAEGRTGEWWSSMELVYELA